MFNTILELTLIKVTVLVFKLSFSMDLATSELALVLRSVFEVHHAFTMLGIIFPVSDIHVSIWIFSKAVSIEATVNKGAFIANTAVFNEHSQAVVFAQMPVALIVLTLVLPNIESVSAEVILYELTLETMVSLLE